MPPTIQDIIHGVQGYASGVDPGLLLRAHEFAVWAHEDTPLRKSGDPFVTHPLEAALILTEIQADPLSVVAGILHDVIEENEKTKRVTVQTVEEAFGPVVARIVDGVTKVGKLRFQTRQEESARNLSKLLEFADQDIRVITVKLADRLHNMRTLGHMSEEHQHRKALETRLLYAPLAHRLGVWRIKWELEDLALKYLGPQVYSHIVDMLGRTRDEREREIEAARAEVSEELAKAAIPAEVQGRPKHIHSIYSKMRTQGVGFDQIGDIMALRILVDTREDCYQALSAVNRVWMPIQGMFTDYIAHPKPNQYQSLHTKVVRESRVMEVQIRTHEMHKVAEYGLAAHWNYKEGKPDQAMDQHVRALRELGTDVNESHELVEMVQGELAPKPIHVFTPQGHVVDLPSGATPLDFAYRVHTEVGHHCVGARVNGRLVPLDYHLASNDVAQIITNPSAEPNRDWMRFVVSGHAKAKIRRYLRQKSRDESIALGREHLQREISRLKHADREALDLDRLPEIATHLNYQDVDGLYAAIGFGDVEPENVIRHLRALAGPLSLAEEVARFAKRGAAPAATPEVTSEGVKGFSSRLSKCCNPLPGDDIVGYITRGGGLAIHRLDCSSLKFYADREPERVLELSWEKASDRGVPTQISVLAVDRVGLFSHITAVVSELGLNITSADARMQDDHVARLTLTVQIPRRQDLDNLIQHLESLIDVMSVRQVSASGDR